MTLHLSQKCKRRSLKQRGCIILWRKGFKFFGVISAARSIVTFAFRKHHPVQTKVFVRRFKSCDLIRTNEGALQ